MQDVTKYRRCSKLCRVYLTNFVVRSCCMECGVIYIEVLSYHEAVKVARFAGSPAS